MSAADEEAVRRNYRQFLELMPLTLAIAGLSQSEGGRNFTPDQLAARSQVVANAFKLAKQTVREILTAS